MRPMAWNVILLTLLFLATPFANSNWNIKLTEVFTEIVFQIKSYNLHLEFWHVIVPDETFISLEFKFELFNSFMTEADII